MKHLKVRLVGGAAIAMLATAAFGANFNIPGGDLDAALDAYAAQSGIQIAVSIDAIKGVHTRGVAGNLSSDAALTKILTGTGFVTSHDPSGVITIIPGRSSSQLDTGPQQLAQAAPARRSCRDRNRHVVEARRREMSKSSRSRLLRCRRNN